MPEKSKTGVEVKTRFFPLAFIWNLSTPTIKIDGHPHRKKWGTHFFELSPGRHTIEIYFKYAWMSKCGANSIDVVVEEGQSKRVEYYMPPWMFAKGRMEQT